MLARAAARLSGLLLAAEGLLVDMRQPGSKQLAQAGSELAVAHEAAAEVDWPWGRRARRREPSEGGQTAQQEVPLTTAAPPLGRLAILLTGSVESLLLTPLLSNVVRANAQNRLQVDLFLSAKAPSNFGEAYQQETDAATSASDPKISHLLKGADAESLNQTVMDYICQTARAQLATGCQWELEGNESVPLKQRDSYESMISNSSLLATDAGKAALSRWRSLSRLWSKVIAQEGDEKYSAILVSRGDEFWMAPTILNIGEFKADPRQLSVMPCLDATGINDKAVVMGREAADAMLQLYQAWQQGDELLEDSLTSEEVWFRRATESMLNIKPQPLPAALATYTQSGLPCFRKQTFNLTGDADEKRDEEMGYEQCFGEGLASRPLTHFLNTFSCEARNPSFYSLLWPQQVQKLHDMVADLAGHQERKPIVLTVIDLDEVQMAYRMLSSLQAAGEEANVLVVGIELGICRTLTQSFGVPGKRCLVVQPALDVRRRVFKHAILTTVALSGLTDSVVYTSPRVLFTRPPSSQPELRQAASSRRFYFAKTSALEDPTSCSSETSTGGLLYDLDSSVIHLSDGPEATDLLLRTWAYMDENDQLSQQAALAGALADRAEHVEAAFFPCGMARLQELKTNSIVVFNMTRTNENQILNASDAPLSAEEAKNESARTSWMDRLRNKIAPGANNSEVQPWAKDVRPKTKWEERHEQWEDAWKKRIEELRGENGYNETEARIQRRLKRHQHQHQKHVRYLPPAEAAKVKAKEEQWEAEKTRQKKEDAEYAESRRQAFNREVEKAIAIMEGRGEQGQKEEAQARSSSPEDAAKYWLHEDGQPDDLPGDDMSAA